MPQQGLNWQLTQLHPPSQAWPIRVKHRPQQGLNWRLTHPPTQAWPIRVKYRPQQGLNWRLTNYTCCRSWDHMSPDIIKLSVKQTRLSFLPKKILNINYNLFTTKVMLKRIYLILSGICLFSVKRKFKFYLLICCFSNLTQTKFYLLLI